MQLFYVYINFFFTMYTLLLWLIMFLVHINMSTFRFNPFKKFLQFMVPKKNFIFTFGPSFKVNLYVEFILLNKILQKNS